MVRRKSQGFTLVELLVVISIIGMLAALLLPAVQSAREAGRRANCINNQRQVGLALNQYEQKMGSYPGYVNAQAIQPDPSGNKSLESATRPISWVFSILPYLEQNALYEQYGSLGLQQYQDAAAAGSAGAMVNYAVQMPDNYLKVLTCPSDTRAVNNNGGPGDPSNNASLSYVVNCGMSDAPANNGTAGVTTPHDWPANGVFHFNYPYGNGSSVMGSSVGTGFLGSFPMQGTALEPMLLNSGSSKTPLIKLSKVSGSFISSGDGTTTTLLISENADSGNWTNVWEHQVGFVWQPGLDSSDNPAPKGGADNLTVALLKINDNPGGIDAFYGQDGERSFARPSAYHPGGVVVVFCDGHTNFLTNEISYLVYTQLMTPRGKYAMLNNGLTGQAPFSKMGTAMQGLNKYGNAPLNYQEQ